jgi:hypothetical protein
LGGWSVKVISGIELSNQALCVVKMHEKKSKVPKFHFLLKEQTPLTQVNNAK